jgi:membrane protein CcdC involved in cytochrome C biogenesis
MTEKARRRWTGPLLLLIAVLLISTGITFILRVSYVQHPSWLAVILPPVEVVVGTILLLVPLLRRLSKEPD